MPMRECGDVGREAVASTQIHVVERGGVGRDRERERGEREGRREEEGKGGDRKTKQERQSNRKGQERFRG